MISKRSREQRIVLLIAIFVFCGFGGKVSGQTKRATEQLRVLFIGNSLTYYNNLPEMVRQLAKSRKQKLTFKIIAEPNFSLEDHWNKGDARKEISKGNWDFVVLQQGPSGSPEGRRYLKEYSKIFAKEIAPSKAKLALYMVWASERRRTEFPLIRESYLSAAKEVNGLFIPAGEAWLEAWKRSPEIELYSTDRFHPSTSGSYLAALTIYSQLFKENPIGLPHRFKLSTGEQIVLSAADAKLMQEAAASACKLIFN